ncbi:MAG: hypothetical protein U0269_25050 [Polyangiales bacterium]
MLNSMLIGRWLMVLGVAVLSGGGVCRPAECPCGHVNPSDSCSACNACPDAGSDGQ